MVYSGPSTGCGNCRKRKIKCDEGRPFCNQCRNTKRKCPGYTQIFDLIHRDETKAVQGKARRRQRRASRALQSATPSSTTDSPEGLAPTSALVLQSPPAQTLDFLTVPKAPEVYTIEQYAVCAFFNNYILIPRNDETKRGYTDCLLPLYTQAAENSLLHLVIDAVSLAIAGRSSRRSFHLGQSAFGKALARTKKAIEDPIESLQDETLIAVLFLGLYERITSTAVRFEMSGSHDAGALALVKHRGKANGKSDLSARLALAVYTQVVDHAVNGGILDRPLEDCTRLVQDLPMNAASRQIVLRAELGYFREEAQRVLTSQFPSSEDLDEIIQRGLDVDSRFEAWTQDLPNDWTWQTGAEMPLPPYSDLDRFTYRGRMDVYTDLWITFIWNCHRTSRITLHNLIIDCIDRIVESDSYVARVTQRQHSASICQELVDDVCGSIPFHLGTKDSPGFSDDPLVEYPVVGSSKVSAEHRRVAAAMGGWFLVEPFYFPLLICSNVQHLREGQTDWIETQLQRISRIYNVKVGR